MMVEIDGEVQLLVSTTHMHYRSATKHELQGRMISLRHSNSHVMKAF